MSSSPTLDTEKKNRNGGILRLRLAYGRRSKKGTHPMKNGHIFLFSKKWGAMCPMPPPPPVSQPLFTKHSDFCFNAVSHKLISVQHSNIVSKVFCLRCYFQHFKRHAFRKVCVCGGGGGGIHVFVLSLINLLLSRLFLRYVKANVQGCPSPLQKSDIVEIISFFLNSP